VSAEISFNMHWISTKKMKPKKRRQRKISEERILAVKAEVQRLLDANVIREVKYSDWLANILRLASKYSASSKEEWQNENVHRFP
jgi:hypothetical protein